MPDESLQKYHAVTISAHPDGFGSRVWIDGKQVRGVREIGMRSVYDGATEVTITFIASVNKVEAGK
jgi:hypothetical protein